MRYTMPPPPKGCGEHHTGLFLRFQFNNPWQGILAPHVGEETTVHANLLFWHEPWRCVAPTPHVGGIFLIYDDRDRYNHTPLGRVRLLRVGRDDHYLRVKVLDVWPLKIDARAEGQKLREQIGKRDEQA